MPHYHFNIHDGPDGRDEDGIDLPDVRTARVEALKLVGEMLRDAALRCDAGSRWSLDVTDGSGLVLLRVDVAIQPP